MVKRNPFQSQAQRRLFYAKAKRGEISPKVVREWERETGKRKLPERANPRWMKGYRAVDAGRGIMTDAVQGGIYFFPKRETAELWAGRHGHVIERLIRTDTASVQAVAEGGLPYHAGETEDVIIRTDPEGSGKVLEIIVFNKAFLGKRKLPERANPSHGPSSKALKKYKATHWGIEANATMRKDDPDLPGELVEMGKLLEIGVVPETQAKPYALSFPDYEETSLAFSQGKDERLYPILPKRAEQAVKKAHWKPNEPTVRLGEVNKLTGGRMDKFRCPAIQVQVLGRANYIVYQTRKLDDLKEDGQASHYIHDFGEETGILPYICVAQDGTLWFAGGDYRVLDGGIAN